MRPIRLVIPIFLISAAALIHRHVPVPAATAHDSRVVASHDIPPETAPPPPDPSPPMPSGEELQRLIQRAEADGYAVHSQDGTFTASNGRHGISAQWSDGTLKLEPLDHRTMWHFSMTPATAATGAMHDGEQLRFDRGGMTEWFVNDARGLEHGFDVPTPPTREGKDGFRVTMALATSLTPEVVDGGRSLRFTDPDGHDALHYRGLVVFDAMNRSLPASMDLARGESEGAWQLAIHVDDRDARYPLVIDPVFTTRLATINANPLTAQELFGTAVSMSGDLLAVGAPGSDGPNPGETDIGSVILFRYQSTFRLWQFEKRLYPDGEVGAAAFGTSLDLDGDTLIVGAPGDDAMANESGAAYVLHRDEGGTHEWGQVAKLVPSNGMTEARFGSSVAVDGGLAVIGAPRHSAVVFNGGAIYVSHRNSDDEWSIPLPVGGYAPESEDQYGRAVAIDGSRIAAGAMLGETVATPADAGIVAVHDLLLDENGVPVSHNTVIVTDPNPSSSSFFGASLALQGNTLVVGSSNQSTGAGAGAGTVEIFRHNGAGWLWQQELHAPDAKPNDRFGTALSLSGDTLAAGAPYWDSSAADMDTGCLYLFERSSGPAAWAFTEQVTRNQKEATSYYGSTISLSGDGIAVGAPYDDAGALADAGLVETLLRNSSAWRAVVALDGSSEPGLRRGESVAMDRSRAAVGFPGWFTGAIEHGAVGVSSANHSTEDSWGVEDLLTGPDEQHGELFGHSVAIAGNWLLVGAPGYDKGGLADAGRAYLFRRTDALGWTFYMALDMPMLTAGAEFGTAVALTERWAFVGAPGMSHGFVFDRYKGGTDAWEISTILDESAGGGRFGSAVTVDGNFAAFSAPRRAGVSPPAKVQVVNGAGQVLVYQALVVAGQTVWQAVKTLPEPAPDGSFGTFNGEFGSSLSIRGGLLLAGEPGHNLDAGRVKVFGINQGGSGNWGELKTLVAPDAIPGDRFGHSVVLDDRWFFAGAPGRSGCGEIFTYDRADLSDLTPQPASRLLHPRGMTGDEFGAALAFSDNELIAGAPGSAGSSGLDDAGRTVVFHRQSAGWNALGGAQGSLANSGDRLGSAVAIGDEFLVVGAPSDTVGGLVSAGSAYLYQRNHALATGWSYVKMLFAADVEIGANFGAAVAIDGDTIAIGAPGWDDRGAVYVFRRNQGGANAWGQQKRVDLAAILAGDEFGAAVSVEDDLLAVGSPHNNAPGAIDAGIVHVFGRHQGGTSNWGLLDDFRETVPAAFDFFGSAVDLSDGRVMVGAPLADNSGDASGAAYVYGRISGLGEWVLLDTLLAVDPNDRLGGSVSLDGSLAVAGAPGDSFHAPNSGAALVFRDTGGDAVNWFMQTRITVGDTENPVIHNGLELGSAVAIKGDQITVGARGYDEGALVNVGAAYVFERNQTQFNGWGLVKRLVALAGGTSARMGSSVAMTSEFVVAGAPEAEQGAAIDAGYFFLFGDIGSSYETWARAKFGDAAVNNAGLQATVWGADADPDHDGLPNAIEAYMDLDPEVADPSGQTGITREANGDLVFHYRMGKETHGAEGRVKWSRDLATWDGGENEDHSDFEIVTRVLSDETDHFLMEARIDAEQLEGEPRLFLRLEVNVP